MYHQYEQMGSVILKTAELLHQCLLDEFKTPEAALRHLCDRFVAECELNEYVRRGASPGFMRMAPATTGKIDDVPTAECQDQWIETGREATLP